MYEDQAEVIDEAIAKLHGARMAITGTPSDLDMAHSIVRDVLEELSALVGREVQT